MKLPRFQRKSRHFAIQSLHIFTGPTALTDSINQFQQTHNVVANDRFASIQHRHRQIALRIRPAKNVGESQMTKGKRGMATVNPNIAPPQHTTRAVAHGNDQ